MSVRRVLVVEDDEAIRETMKDVLESEGYVVETAENGREGLERLRAMPRPCVILLDLMMPVMSGGEFLDEMHEDDVLASLPVVVVSAWPNEASHVAARTQGFMKKPVSLDSLLATVRQFCGELDERGHAD